MALRLRRGTDAERLTITPVEGELIYTTDFQELWIGDGTTTGGNKIGGIIPQFLTDLDNVNAASPEIGQVLKWDGSNWVASTDENTGVVEDASYKINILGTSNTTIVDSDTATFTGSFVGDGSGLTNLPIATDGSGVIEGSNYRINIVDDSSTLMVNTTTNTFTGNFVGDGSGLTNVPSGSVFDLNDVFAFTPPDPGDILTFDGFNFVPEKIRRIEGIDSTIIVDAFTNTFTGNFVGDGSGLTNLPSSNVQSIFDLNDVFAFTPPDPGDILTFDGFNFVPEKITIIQGTDSTIIVDAFTNTFTGNFVGDGSGLTNLPGSIVEGSNYRINIVDSSSTVMVDTTTNTFTGNFVGDGSGLTNLPGSIVEGSNYRINIVDSSSTVMVDGDLNQISANSAKINQFISDFNFNPEITFISENSSQTDVIIKSDENIPRLYFYRSSEFDISSDNLRYGQLVFGRDDINGRVNTARISSNKDFLWLGHQSNGNIQDEDILYISNGSVGIGTTAPASKLDINGDLIVRSNGTFTGTVDAASFKGSVVADDSSTIVDAVNGTISVSGFILFGSLTTSERNSLIPANGMVIYNSTDNKFQGYQNNIWINLDGS
jgi:hypothetical protein